MSSEQNNKFIELYKNTDGIELNDFHLSLGE